MGARESEGEGENARVAEMSGFVHSCSPVLHFASGFCGRRSISSDMFRVAGMFVLLSTASLPVGECKSQSNPSFALAAGISAASEQCVVAAGSSVSLSSCAKAVASGDGSDIWSFSNGQLVSAASGLRTRAVHLAQSLLPTNSG